MKKARRKRDSYTTGELNKLIDSLCHPLCKKEKGFILIDGLLHGMVEQNPPTSIKKFIKYNLPTLLKELDEPKGTRTKKTIKHATSHETERTISTCVCSMSHTLSPSFSKHTYPPCMLEKRRRASTQVLTLNCIRL